MSHGAGKISAKITLDQDAYNELILMVNCIVMGLMKDAIDGDDGEVYFADVQKLGGSSKNWPDSGTIDSVGNTDEITKFFNGLDALVQSGASTWEKVCYVEPFARSLPATLVKWVVKGIAVPAINNNLVTWGVVT